MSAEQTIRQGDCVEVLKEYPEGSFTACVTDPPYFLGFMGKKWDSGDAAAFHLAWLREVFRVLKPGAFLLAFGGTRTWHRLACAMEEAGFELRDTLMWIHGQGFPKSLDVSKAIDKMRGAERDLVPATGGLHNNRNLNDDGWAKVGAISLTMDSPIAVTPDAALWSGYGTALKPAWEPILVAMKPIADGLGNIASNALVHGCGGLNVDGARIGTNETWVRPPRTQNQIYGGGKGTNSCVNPQSPLGRWPPNVALTHDPRCVRVGTERIKATVTIRERSRGKFFGGGKKNPPAPNVTTADGPDGREGVEVWACVPGCPVRMLDDQGGIRKSGKPGRTSGVNTSAAYGRESRKPGTLVSGYGDVGPVSRFFYCSKASTAEREAGCEEIVPEKQDESREEGAPGGDNPRNRGAEERHNNHPTVKPLALMEWLLTLVRQPTDNLVLDPFLGSGTTLIAARRLGISAVGVEREPRYVEIARARLAGPMATPEAPSEDAPGQSILWRSGAADDPGERGGEVRQSALKNNRGKSLDKFRGAR